MTIKNDIPKKKKKEKPLSTTPTCNFDATELFFIYFVIYSFNDGNFFKDILYLRHFDNFLVCFFARAGAPGRGRETFFRFSFLFLFHSYCFRH